MSIGNGKLYVGQIELAQGASQSNHAVRSDDPRLVKFSEGGVALAGYPLTIVNGGGSATNGNAVYIKSDGSIANAFSTMLEPVIPFVLAGDKLFTSGTIAKSFANNLYPGRAYWLSAFGPPSLNTPTTSGEWVVRVGIALNSTDLIVDLQVMGTV